MKFGTIFLFFVLNIFNANATLLSYTDSLLASIDHLSIEEKVDRISDECWSLREKKSHLAIQLGNLALAISTNSKYKKRIPELYNYIGAIYLNYLHDINNSVPFFEKALDASIDQKDSVQTGYAYNNLGDLYFRTNNIPLALNYDKKSYDIFVKLKNKRGICYSLTNLGEAYLAKNEFANSREYFVTLYENESKLNNIGGISFSLLQIGHTYFEEGNYILANKYYQKADSISTKFENNTFKAECLTSLAKIKLVNNQFDEAIDLVNKALDLNISSEYIPGIINTKLSIAILLARIGNYTLGQRQLNEAVALANQLQFPAYILKAYNTRVEFNSILNDSNGIINSYKEYFAIYDSLYLLQSFETLDEMQNNLHTQLLIEKIQKNDEIKTKFRLLMYIIIALLLFMGIVFFWRFRTTRLLNIRLKETNNTKDKLFSIIAHDLKSPFNSILGLSEILQSELEEKKYENAIKYSSSLTKTANETYSLIINLLNWARAQREIIKMAPENILLSSFIDEIIKIKEPQALNKKIALIKETSKYDNIYTDRNSLFIVISNLVSNAIKFTPENGNIIISTKEVEDFVTIKIADEGVGIPEQYIDDIFNIQKSKSTLGTNNEKGTGLGLIICKEFIEQLGGKISVKSVEGKGSIFKIKLPARMRI